MDEKKPETIKQANRRRKQEQRKRDRAFWQAIGVNTLEGLGAKFRNSKLPPAEIRKILEGL